MTIPNTPTTRHDQLPLADAFATILSKNQERGVGVPRPGVRITALHRVRTLPHATRYSKAAVADGYRRRGQVGVYVRALKDDLAIGVRRCQTPAMVRKEIALSAVAFHAVRAVMVVGGRGGEPRAGAAEFHGGERSARVVCGAVVGPRGSWGGVVGGVTSDRLRRGRRPPQPSRTAGVETAAKRPQVHDKTPPAIPANHKTNSLKEVPLALGVVAKPPRPGLSSPRPSA